MKKFIYLTLAMLSLAGCEANIEVQHKQVVPAMEVTCFSGGKEIFKATVQSAEAVFNTTTMEFIDADTGKVTRVSGDCVVAY